MEEQKTKQFEELNKYERAMATASLENKLEAMLHEVQQMALALKISITLDTSYYNRDENQRVSGCVSFYNGVITQRYFHEPGDFFGIIDEALAKKPEEKKED